MVFRGYLITIFTTDNVLRMFKICRNFRGHRNCVRIGKPIFKGINEPVITTECPTESNSVGRSVVMLNHCILILKQKSKKT